MNEKRRLFGMLNVNETLYSIGGETSTDTMEIINLNYETKWTQIKLGFKVHGHCMVNIGTKIYVLGGWSDRDGKIVF